MRTSSYTIYVTTSDPDKVVIINSLSGATDVVRKPVADYLRSMRRPGDEQWVAHPTEPIADGPLGTVEAPSEHTLERLRRRGYITDVTADEEQQHLVRIVNVIHNKAKQRPSFLLIPSYDCNLRCAYCFQNDLRVKEENRPRLVAMTPERTDRIFAAIRELQPTDPSAPPTRNLTLYGGEPFLAENVKNIEYIVEKAHAEGFTSIGAITNATELQHYPHVMGPGGVGSLQITLDGPREAHNRSRIHKDGLGAGTFDQIVENISLLLPRGVKISLRVNVTRVNAPELGELAAIARERGWADHPNFRAYVAPVHYPSKTPPPEGFTPHQLDLFMAASAAERDPGFDLFARPDSGIKGQFLQMFRNKTVVAPRSSFCSSHTGMYLFDALGDIYSCWEWVGFSQLRVGKVDFETGALSLNTKQLERWHSRNIANVPTCRKCQYSLYCGGGCAVYATAHTGKFMNSHCNSFPAVFQQGVRDAFATYEETRQHPDAVPVGAASGDDGILCR